MSPQPDVVTAVDTILRIKADNAHHLNSGTMRGKGGHIYLERSNSLSVSNTGIVDIGTDIERRSSKQVGSILIDNMTVAGN